MRIGEGGLPTMRSGTVCLPGARGLRRELRGLRPRAEVPLDHEGGLLALQRGLLPPQRLERRGHLHRLEAR